MFVIDSILTAAASVRIQDLFDIAIIAVMISALMTWFKSRASRFVLIGIILLGAVYIVARFFNLYLTTIVLQGFFAILIFVLVVIFQEDLRAFFERLAMLGNIGKKARQASGPEETAEIIAQAAGNLAKKHIGALIVLAGEDPLDRHINGGTNLDGIISETLLESIFDPHSTGHDGAVIIKDNRVTMFGCHLPLSRNTSEYGNIGLRHTAALGLAERSTALCVVVSEERGTISLAYEGELTLVNNVAALRQALDKFYLRNAPPVAHSSPLVKWLKENTREKIIALMMAFVLWVAFGYQRDEIRRDIIVPIEYKNIPSHWRIDEPQITEAKVILKGPTQAFRLLNERALKLSLDLSAVAEKKREFILTREMVNAPSNLTVSEISPAKIRIFSSRFITHSFPIHVVKRNSLSQELILQRISVNPSSISLLMDSRLSPDQIRIETEPVDLQEITETTALDVRIVIPAGVSFPEKTTPVVRVTIKVKNKPS